MAAGTHVVVLSQVLRLVPSPVLAALDAWSYGLALRRAARRRQAANPRLQPAPIRYKLNPWRD